MDRKIPHEASETIDFYLRTIYSVLRSKSETRISGFEEAHISMFSTMHPDARGSSPDFNALIYTLLRLPNCMINVQKVILGQNVRVFIQCDYTDIADWEVVSARARRRFCQYNGKDTLACFITSKSDIDDIVPELTAFQIEWNKLHELLRDVPDEDLINISPENDNFSKLAEQILSPVDDLMRLYSIWGKEMGSWLLEIKNRASEMRIRLLDSSLVQYARSANSWMVNIIDKRPDISNRPIYIVSSNTHSLANLVSGYALEKEDELVSFLSKEENAPLKDEWNGIEKQKLSASRENFLYYVLKKYQQTKAGAYTIEEQREAEMDRGIYRVPSIHSFDIEAQIFDFSCFDPDCFDQRIRIPEKLDLSKSDAIILNFDYPLGLTAFNILSKLSEQFEKILGVYMMGKAASLNGVHGDVIIPTVVHDMHSENTYLFSNAFSGADIEPWLIYGSILDNQRAVSVFGTFLQNKKFMEALYRGGYTDIEMESGPYLSAVYEMSRPQRHPTDEIVDLFNSKIDIGILHYVSDTPMSKGKNLGAGTLSYFGMDSTYATTIAIARRIFEKEMK